MGSRVSGNSVVSPPRAGDCTNPLRQLSWRSRPTSPAAARHSSPVPGVQIPSGPVLGPAHKRFNPSTPRCTRRDKYCCPHWKKIHLSPTRLNDWSEATHWNWNSGPTWSSFSQHCGVPSRVPDNKRDISRASGSHSDPQRALGDPVCEDPDLYRAWKTP